MIEVGNKIDLLEKDEFTKLAQNNPDHLFISVTEKINLPILAERIQDV